MRRWEKQNNPVKSNSTGLVSYLRFLGGAFLPGCLEAGRLPADLEISFLPTLGGGAEFCRGGTARIRHFGLEPIRSSRWAFNRASRTK